MALQEGWGECSSQGYQGCRRSLGSRAVQAQAVEGMAIRVVDLEARTIQGKAPVVDLVGTREAGLARQEGVGTREAMGIQEEEGEAQAVAMQRATGAVTQALIWDR